ncbi:uncharacterized protein LTR77_005810 [Saxophila tyrrhenica]|uniref:Sialidase n=1 Tax=Saxophila tyrrhenica TaxID=1690608 RepID=A0AAV9PDL0_9PEZI|nr:hypothetical protein LTR77_005810 [Saxophila tyrrhenica]
MDYRQVTPPLSADFEDYVNFQCPGGSASTNASFWPNDWSPESVMTAGTHITTPPKSPARIREIGPTLLPRVRPQDQSVQTAPTQAFHGHSRTTSLPADAYHMQFGSYLPPVPSLERRSASPAPRNPLPTPGSASLTYDHMMNDTASRRPSLAGNRSVSATNIRSHSRNSSSTSIDASVLGRFGFPTYRHSPSPGPMPANSAAMSRTPSAMSHLVPIMMPNGHVQSYPARRRTASPPANPSRLSVEVEFDPQLDLEESSIIDYLTAPNPTPSLVQRTVEANRPSCPHVWFDVRNVTSWSDFNISTLSAVPGLLDLLQVKVAVRNLPGPPKVNLNPETATQLADMCAKHHAVKVNAALKLALGEKHMAMRALQSAGSARQQPEFVSNYQSDVEKTIYGDGRGRVVGVAKCYDQWNSGFRNGTPENKVQYLRGLAHLHHFMREHGCRYGFIMTEIELVCVRAGGPSADPAAVPLFGFLEVADPVRISDSGMNENGNLRMTAGLALWYLHMLAKERPFDGQLHWKMEVGGPTALTRQHHLARDSWMPKPNVSEKRTMKRVRGWVFPEEPLSNREVGRGRRNRVG